MSTALSDALSAVAATAEADFDHSNPDAVIGRATRTVRRYRAALATGATLGSATLVAGVLWGAESLGTRTPETEPSSEAPSGVQDPGETPWSTLALAAVTEPRKYGERRIDSAAGMICRHEKPADDPRVAIEDQTDPLGPAITTIANCVPVWFKNGPITSDRNATASITLASAEEPAAVTSGAVIGNLSDKPIMIDGDSVFMWIETDPESPGAPPPVAYSHTLIGASMWSDAGDTTALLGSTALPTRIVPGQYLVASAIATEMEGDGPLADLIESGANFTVTFWARIHEEGPTGGSTYLLRLGEEHTYGGVEQ